MGRVDQSLGAAVCQLGLWVTRWWWRHSRAVVSVLGLEVCCEGASAGFFEGEGHEGVAGGLFEFGVLFAVAGELGEQFICERLECLLDGDSGFSDETARDLDRRVSVWGQT